MAAMTPDDLGVIFTYTLPQIPRHDRERFIELVRWLARKLGDADAAVGSDDDDPMTPAEIEEGIRRFEARQELRGTSWRE